MKMTLDELLDAVGHTPSGEPFLRASLLKLARWHDAEANGYADIDPRADEDERQLAKQAISIHRDAATCIRAILIAKAPAK